ncbi:phosphatase PAP2 family protein [Ralstonia soli]|uniref:Phosphatase PAP2 family protein n=1 Tax=Ralstonia soli TaxID=2953896 RepID=A0ABT1AJN0_9RALS|nr:phosphatase PAP2 family protein [Ralstonia soli]MCO5398523.1 phosphatase PAP2 family protein [Ralstonia soli]
MKTTTRVFTQGDLIRWSGVLVVVVLDGVWLAASGRSITGTSLAPKLASVLLLAGISIALALIAGLPTITATPRGMHYRRFALVAQSGALIVTFTCAMSVLSYLLVSIAPPIVDTQLAAIDAQLGFDWPHLYIWVHTRPTLHLVLQLTYYSALLQLGLIPMLAGLLGRSDHLREFVANLMLSCALLLVISTPWPAAGAFVFYGIASPSDLAMVSHFGALRDGTMRVIDLAQMQGLVSLPSYHTAMALFFVQAMRWTRTGLVLSGLLNALMILATPTEGGHYLVDVIAGVALWAVTIGALRLTVLRKRVPAAPKLSVQTLFR